MLTYHANIPQNILHPAGVLEHANHCRFAHHARTCVTDMLAAGITAQHAAACVGYASTRMKPDVYVHTAEEYAKRCAGAAFCKSVKNALLVPIPPTHLSQRNSGASAKTVNDCSMTKKPTQIRFL